MSRFLALALLVLELLSPLTLLVAAAPVAQEDSASIVALVNGMRLAAGLAPLRVSEELSAAAQRHSVDMAATSQVAHVGSDGSRPDERIAAAGYAAYGDGLFHGENVYAGASAAEALLQWQDSPSDLGNLTRVEFREIGVGIAPGEEDQFYIVVTFGARPNVLPVFVNDDATETGSAAVTLALTNELHQPGGQGGDILGRATEVRISNEPGFTDAEWRPWATRLPWTLTPGEGLKTVYVQFRDTQGRITAATVSITLSALAPTATATGEGAGAHSTARPETTAQVTPGGTAVPGLSSTPGPGRTSTAPSSEAVSSTPVPATADDIPAGDAPVAPGLLAIVCGLQIVGVLLTAYLVLRRGQG